VVDIKGLFCFLFTDSDKLKMAKNFLVKTFRLFRRILVLLFDLVQIVASELIQKGVERKLSQHRPVIFLFF
jgi:hypothetical protein